MKRTLATLLLALPLFACAQQLSQYTQYVFNQFSVNPAVAGSKDCMDLRLGYRKQWTGMEGAPVTGWMSLHGSIRKKGKPFVLNKHGVGMMMESDNAGNWGYTRFLLAWAYHIKMSQDYFLSFGAFGGAQQMKFDYGSATTVQPNDPALNGRASSLVIPEVTPGVWAYTKVAWAGLSMHQALGNKIKDIGLDSKLARQFMMSAGYKYRLAKHTALMPCMLMKFSKGVPPALDINLMVEWNKKLSIGVGHRNTDAVVFLLKVPFAKYFQLGYSYDVNTSKLRVANNNTHEVILSITPCGYQNGKPAMIACPAFD
ncbi:MAG TPA: type IX secretion system membrane protein PorP/SprF [Flavobacteriales bacterium]|nr:type IX secretion system membrane protein PorP/SprF [Flavobacteriales bacterium]